MQTLPDLRSCVQEHPTQVEFCVSRTEYTYSRLHLHTREFNLSPSSNTVEPNRPLHECPTACVIAQQYYSVTLVSMRFRSHKEKFDAFQKRYYSIFGTFLKIA